jgi:hypothetical protein
VLATAPLGAKVNWNIEVYDSQNRLVDANSGGSKTLGVSLAGKPTGTYFVHVFSDGGHGLGDYRLALKSVPPAASPPQSFVVTPANSALPNARLNSVVQNLLSDGELSRQDWIGAGGIFDAVEADGKVTTSEFNSLKAIIANASVIDAAQSSFGSARYPMYNYVFNLAGKVINGNFANATYQDQPLGNLAANSPATQLAQLVDKWFLGLDRPDAGDNPYQQAAANPFFGPNGPMLDDINQGDVGDCYFLSSVGTILSKELVSGFNHIAVYNPATGQDPNGLFINNGDNTYTVKFFFHSQSTGQMVADYVTVDNYFPTYNSGNENNWTYANGYGPFSNPNTPIWVAVVEKAFVQENASAVWSSPSDTSDVRNAYKTINGLYNGNLTLMYLTGQTGYLNTTNLSNLTYQQVVAAYNAGVGVVFGTKSKPPVDVNTGSVANNHPLVGDHDYMMFGFNNANQTILLRNPWGVNNTNGGTYDSTNPPASTNQTYLIIEATVDFLRTNFNGYYAINPNKV